MNNSKIGLALGSGAAKGYAHIGVLQVFEEEKIPIDIIVGSSIGSLIGALYASGIDAVMLEKLAEKMPQAWIDLTIPKIGLMAGQKIEEIIRLLTKNQNFDELNMPLGVMATDLSLERAVLLTEVMWLMRLELDIAIPGFLA